MGISGLSNNIGRYSSLSKQRFRQDNLPVSVAGKVNKVTGQESTLKNSADEQPRPSISQSSPIPDTNQIKEYAKAESVSGTNLSREPGISRYNHYAISAYQSTENQEKRDQIEKMLGVDLYV